jgi:SAM-dependent methyltransferase
MVGRNDRVTDAKTALVRALWDSAADVYDDAIVPALSDAHHALLRTLDPQRGERILDLGCGTGRMAELVAHSGAQLAAAVDLAPEMVARARARLAGTGIDIREMDAQSLTFDDASFDAVVAGFSLMFCVDHLAALCEVRRVLRPGGRLALSVWGLSDECDSVRVGRVAAAFGEGPLPDTPTGQSLGDPVHLRGLLDAAGFTSIEMRAQVMRLRYPGPDACWASVHHIHGERIPAGRLAEAEAATRDQIAHVGLPLHNRAWFVRASR